MVDTFEQLLGGEELYHYHSKLMMKEVLLLLMLMIVMMLRTMIDVTHSPRLRQAVSMCGTRTMVTGAFLEIKTNSNQENGEMTMFKVDK